ncbi:MAG: hypothetical protein V9E98_06690 [Candidatus Nanopelagicales bacterium]
MGDTLGRTLWLGIGVGFLGAVTVGALVLGWLPTRGSAASLGTLTVANTLKVESNTILPVASVRSNALGAGNDLDNDVTDYNTGGGYVNNAGPTWNTVRSGSNVTGAWIAPAGNFVARNSGPAATSYALIPWVAHRSSLRNRSTNFSTSTDIGYVLGTNSTGTSTGIAARIYHDTGTTYRVQLIDVGSGSQCGSDDLNLGNLAGDTIDTNFSYNPGTSTASVTVTGAPVSPVTATCTYSDASGTYAGLVSYDLSTTRYTLNATTNQTPTTAFG